MSHNLRIFSGLTVWCPAAHIYPIQILPSAYYEVHETTIRPVPSSSVVIGADQAGTALNHICSGIYGLTIDLRRVIEQTPLRIFITIAGIASVSDLRISKADADLLAPARPTVHGSILRASVGESHAANTLSAVSETSPDTL